MMNLDLLPATGAVVISTPLKILNGSGSPCGWWRWLQTKVGAIKRQASRGRANACLGFRVRLGPRAKKGFEFARGQ